MDSGHRVFDTLLKSSWLTLDQPMIKKFVDFIYPTENLAVVNKAWQLLSVKGYWADDP